MKSILKTCQNPDFINIELSNMIKMLTIILKLLQLRIVVETTYKPLDGTNRADSPIDARPNSKPLNQGQ